LEKAGAFDHLKITPEGQVEEGIPFWRSKESFHVYLSAVFLFLGWYAGEFWGETQLYSILLYATSMLVGGYQLFMVGLRNLLRLEFDMRTLMTIAVIGAGAIGEWGEGATVVILFAISEALETYSMDKARLSIRTLMDIAPKEALIRRGQEEMNVSVDDIEIDDIMLVKPGQKLAMDGVIVKGTSTINQAAITGESVPVPKTVEDEVFAGTLNEEGYLEVKVTKRIEDTTIAKIIHLVEEAQAERAPAQAFVDQFAKYYTPAIMLLALGVATVPPLFFGADWSKWIYEGLAVLVVGCPCALVVSTPVSIVTAVGTAARHGVLIKGGIHLEEAGKITAIAFDKTGTLTKGVPEVTEFVSYIDEKEMLRYAAALEKGSQHPLASSILRKAEAMGIEFNQINVDHFSSITGKGITGQIEEKIYYVGNPLLFEELNVLTDEIKQQVATLQQQGKTVMVVGTAEQVLGFIAVADEVREQSKAVIQELHDMGIKSTIMLTGDNQATAESIARQVGVREVQADLLPQEKLDYIKAYRSQGKRVAMVGDGVNDAPALAASSVGIAMGGAGTDTALETADIALMADDLSKLPFTIQLSRRTLGIIKQNIAFSIGIKAFALLLVIPGWLTLWMAIFADMGATLLVTLNSLRLLRTKK